MSPPRQDFRFGMSDAQVSALLLESDDLSPTLHDLAEAPAGKARKIFLRRRAATRRLVAERLTVALSDVEIGHDRSGAPRLVKPEAEIFLSISGRANFCAIALASAPIGVDIEPLERRSEPVWSALHPREAALLRTLPQAAQSEAFLRLWTAKEAYLKARGVGFRQEPATIAVDLDFRLYESGREIQLAARGWRIVTLAEREFLLACVVLASEVMTKDAGSSGAPAPTRLDPSRAGR